MILAFNWFIQFTFHGTLFLSVCLAVAGYSLRKQLSEGRSADGRIIGVLALAGMFCFFTIGMTLTSGKYVFENITNIDALRTGSVYHIAVRIPRDSPPSPNYMTITYPLPLPTAPGQTSVYAPASRDRHATNMFAILKTAPGENPFNLGPWRNFKSVMGNTPFEWFLPIKHSPCCDHDSMVSDYDFGPLVEELKKRYAMSPARKLHAGMTEPSLSSNDTF